MVAPPKPGGPKSKERVLVAMSGGMDSAVVALLLKSQGYEVIGIHIVISDAHMMASARLESRCAKQPDVAEVRKLCERIDIPLHVVDAREEFIGRVLDYALHESLRGRIAATCVVCHMDIRIRHLLSKAEEIKPDWIATGHHAQILHGEGSRNSRLLRGVDGPSDQSALLFSLKQEQLSRLLMPLGSVSRAMVRKMAVELKVPIDNEQTETNYCISNHPGFSNYVAARSPIQFRPPGTVITSEGHVRGQHKGIYQYRVGQFEDIPGGDGEKDGICVIKIDSAANTIVIGPKSALASGKFIVSRLTWITPIDGLREFKCQAQIASSAQTAKCRIYQFENNTAHVILEQPLHQIPAGLPVVFYDGEECLGGAWIDSVERLGD